jgi:hypothetical protein
MSSGLKSATAKGSSATTLLNVHSVSCRRKEGDGREGEREREGRRERRESHKKFNKATSN